MKIGVDVHGTIDRCPDLFRFLIRQWRKDGHTVVIVSGPPKDGILLDLASMNYQSGREYDEIVSVVDFLKDNGALMHYNETTGSWWTDEDKWVSSKGLICDYNNIDVLIDDTEYYFEHLNPFVKGILIKSMWSVLSLLWRI